MFRQWSCRVILLSSLLLTLILCVQQAASEQETNPQLNETARAHQQTGEQQATGSGSTKLAGPAVLRPSIEEVASELSKKHLNLANDYWRGRSASSSSLAPDDDAPQEQSPGTERDLSLARVNDTSASAGSPASALELTKDEHHYVHIDAGLPDQARPTPSRRRKASARQLQARPEEGDLYQCQLYLLRHGTSPTWLPISSSMAGPQLPCSCERRAHFSQPTQIDWWLNCDSVQLIGTHFYLNQDDQTTNRSQPVNGNTDNDNIVELGRFSQRNSGLQTLHSQKFYHLRLFKLRSIDLSNNRIRSIKIDAFHGLETSLESLNLANNLLGDSRAVFESGRRQGGPDEAGNREAGSADRSAPESNQAVLASDEINRLKRLRWLSLRNNLISHLSPNIFRKQSSAGSSSADERARSGELESELVSLDLAENLLRAFPSEAVHLLIKLESLNLNRNKILRLDQSSRFPRSLKYLDLSENLIKSIRHCDLIDLPELIELNLSHNQLSQLDKTAFLTATSGANLQDMLVESSALGERRITDLSELGEGEESSERTGLRRPQRSAPVEETAGEGEELDDLRAEESIVSDRPTISGEINLIQQLDQFNSTRKLNLSYNLFEQLPGDALLKFPNLDSLDLSFNRLRLFDPNYLCSIYNLVENLKILDLSGNLLSMPKVNQGEGGGLSIGGGGRQLNKLFGCLQRLERLALSTNRLAAWDRLEPPLRGPPAANLAADQDEQPAKELLGGRPEGERLTIRFGDSLASKSLVALDLSDNQLRSVPIIEQVTNPIVVQQTNSSATNLTSQQFKLNQWIHSIVYLEDLDLSFNYIDRLEEHDFEHLFNLRRLQLDNNKLAKLPVRLMRRFTSLDVLSLSSNRIATLDPFNELFECSLKTLRVLNLANNRITEWPQLEQRPESATSRARADPDTSSLWFALEELNLEGNFLTSNNASALFDQMAYMRSLRVLNLSHNLLNRVRSEWFKFANGSLQKLLLTGNKINSIDLGSFAFNQANELVQLSLNLNHLKELRRKTFDYLPKLRELNLANNLIHTIQSETFSQLGYLQILKLNNNKLTSWKCEYFAGLCNSISGSINANLSSLLSPSNPNQSQLDSHLAAPPVSSLLELDLSHNSLSQLRANSIAVHTRLTKLDLSHNKLSFIPQDLFKATTAGSGRYSQLVSSLRYLSLAHNRIQTIDNVNFKPLRNLVSFDLSFNELQTLGLDLVRDKDKQESGGKLGLEEELSRAHNTSSVRTDWQANQANLSATNWPALTKLRHLNLANNQLSQINQSLLAELSPHSLLNLNLSANYLDSDSLPSAFLTKVSSGAGHAPASGVGSPKYDLIFTLKLESLDLSYNRLNEFPAELLNNHYTSMESCNLSHNRIQNLVANSNLMIHIKVLNLEFNPLSRQSSELILFEQKSARHLNLAATRLYAIQQTSEPVPSSSHHKSRIHNQSSNQDLIRSISRPIDAPYLRHLNLSSNQLVWLSANVFVKMHSLQTLDLSNNQLTRLHLLNNQLLHVSSTLENLNLASNLFTNIDSNDFNQLSRLHQLDLSNLLSLQKFNCRFLSKLTSLKVLKLINYPLLRQSLVTLSQSNGSARTSERLMKKVQYELVMSTIGKHCFQDELLFEHPSEADHASDNTIQHRWLDVEELEVELFNNYELFPSKSSEGFRLEDQLSQLLGPSTRKLSLVGLNLTSLGDESLLGPTSDSLNLKISYTSLSQLPLRQILNCLSRKSRLSLDFRSNIIQTIDTQDLQLLDELQVGNQLLYRGDHSSLKLDSNPIKCDCQTRPLWLWLNRHLGSIDVANLKDIDDDLQASENLNYANNLVKFSSFSQSSDLRCYYPARLRDKLTQHIYYNDLVCKGGLQQSHQWTARKNDSAIGADVGTGADNEMMDAEYDDYTYLQEQPKADQVRLTRFNRYPQVGSRNGTLLLGSVMAPSPSRNSNEQASRESGDLELDTNRLGKRDRHTIDANVPQEAPSNLGFSKHRPNTHQRHAHFNTLSTFNQLPVGKSLLSRNSASSPSLAKHSVLTESDILILTLIAIAMIVMTVIIIAICLFKYRMDRSDRERILTTQTKFMLSHALAANGLGKVSSRGDSGNSKKSKSSSSSSSDSSSKGGRPTRNNSTNLDHGITRLQQAPGSGFQQVSSKQLLVPIRPRSMVPRSQNFLMRSPTIRRMHGLATNASDWFKVTLRAYPTGSTNRRGRLFMGSQRLYSSQLTTAELRANCEGGQTEKLPDLLPAVLAGGCPLHANRFLQSSSSTKVANEVEKCRYCSRLVSAAKQTNQHLAGSRISSGESNRSSVDFVAPKQTKNQARNSLSEGIRANASQQRLWTMVDAQPSHQRSKEMPGSRNSSFYSRHELSKPLRTFGGAIREDQESIKTDLDGSGKVNTRENNPPTVKSEIPTIDVDGRFAYQSESQLDSPDQNLALSPGAQGNQDIFILVHEASKGGSPNGPHACRDHIEILRLRAQDQERPLSTSETMRDECSHSSSPVAYGFMRPSPSATTISSVTTHNQLSDLRQSKLDWSSKFGPDHSACNNNNIDMPNNNYQSQGKMVAPRQKASEEHIDRLPATYRPNLSDEQVIVSRL